MAKIKEQKDIRKRDLSSASTYQSILKSVLMSIKINRPVFLWGPPGIGKSAMMREIAKMLGLGYIDLRMSLLNPVDLRGVPMVDPVDRVAKWMKPVFLPSEEGFLINFDELNVAPPSVQSASYQLILDRECGEYKLPDHCYIVACGNRAEDQAVIHQMPAPLRNRMFHLEMRADLKDWKAWAYDHNINSRVIGYLNWKQEDLFAFDAAQHLRNFPSPRSWEFVSDVCNQQAGDHMKAFDLSDYMDLISGAVGIATATEFLAYSEVAAHLPDIESIVMKGEQPEAPQDPGARYALASGLVYCALSNLIDKPADDQIRGACNILKYVTNRMPKDFAVVCSKDLARTPIWQKNRQKLARTPEATEWVKHCGNVAL